MFHCCVIINKKTIFSSSLLLSFCSLLILILIVVVIGIVIGVFIANAIGFGIVFVLVDCCGFLLTMSYPHNGTTATFFRLLFCNYRQDQWYFFLDREDDLPNKEYALRILKWMKLKMIIVNVILLWKG